MKIKELIAELKKVPGYKDKELEVVLSSDPEGNSYSTLDKKYSICYVFKGEDDFVTSTLHKKLSEEEVGQFYRKAEVIGVCLIPFEENFGSAEEACKGRRK